MNNDKPVTLEAGSYFIGDPCNAFSDADWDSIAIAVVLKAPHLFMHDTAYGDGVYEDQDGHQYMVDSGCLAAVPLAACTGKQKEMLRSGRIVEFKEKFICKYRERNGEFLFGSISIRTDSDD